MADIVPIPGPRGYPIVGNISDIDPENSIASLNHIAETYGEIFKLTLAGTTTVYVSSQRLVNELCDEKRFQKCVSSGLLQVRNGVGHALFTADTQDHEWGVAHRILMPAFGPASIRNMYDEMHDIGAQLVCKWARFGQGEKLNVTEDFTRLTLDSIALCAMGTRFNSFYKEGIHPFVTAMQDFLVESGRRATRPGIANTLMRGSARAYEESIETLKRVAKEGLDERRAHPNDKKDVVNILINGKDPKTGEGMSDELILQTMITFLIAGHETTSGMLSFLFYFFLKNPSTLRKAQQEVDEVVGRGPVTVEHMNKLSYIAACMRETLRLCPSAPGFTVKPHNDSQENPVIIGGKYQVSSQQPIRILLTRLHRDPAVWGSDADEFKPERMLDRDFSQLPPNAWKPFGNGMRGCIGRAFAWQEALMIIAMLLQNFNFKLADPAYQLQIKLSLTMKPRDFFMHAIPREHVDILYLEKQLLVDGSELVKSQAPASHDAGNSSAKPKSKMTVLYGSNSGTCEGFAQTLARSAANRGFSADVKSLDDAQDSIPKGQPVVLISSSYEGQPPDNAAHFVTWLESLKGSKALDGVKYAVYGAGNHDWVHTFHRIPKLLDSTFEALGATRIADTGLGDVASGDIFDDFDTWQDQVFWPKVAHSTETSEDSGLDLDIDVTARVSALRQDVKEAVVLSNDLLTAPGVPEKRHIALKLPSGFSYKSGDYLAVLPFNHQKTVHRALKRFGLPWDAVVTIKPGTITSLPAGQPISAFDLLAAYVELSQPATRKNVQKLVATVPKEAQSKLAEWAGASYDQEILNTRRSVLDILEDFPNAHVTFGEYLAMLPPMRIRQYSISSSPLDDPSIATITLSVLEAPSKVSNTKRFFGVASTFLAHVEESDRVHVAIKPSHGHFHPPTDVEHTPTIYICAGTGLAPFRGFVQERAKQIEAGRTLAPAYLFIGCTDPSKDALFHSELTAWEEKGVVKLYYAYSRSKDQSSGCGHVQDRVWAERKTLIDAFNSGANLYVCGSAAVGEGVAVTVKKIYAEAAEEAGAPKSDEEIQQWFDNIKADRYASDVFT